MIDPRKNVGVSFSCILALITDCHPAGVDTLRLDVDAQPDPIEEVRPDNFEHGARIVHRRSLDAVSSPD